MANQVETNTNFDGQGPKGNSGSQKKGRKVVLAGLGVVAPGAANWKDFLAKMKQGQSTLSRSAQLSPCFMVGNPDFDFSVCQEWISSRGNPSKYQQIAEKGGENVQLALATAIQALESNPGLEKLICDLDERVLVVCGNAFGDLPSVFEGKACFDQATREWNHFWSDSERNGALSRYLTSGALPVGVAEGSVPPPPEFHPTGSACVFRNYDKLLAWDAFWCAQNPALVQFLEDLERIEIQGVGKNVDQDKLHLIRTKTRQKKELYRQTGCPTPPWEMVNPKLLWNLPNAASAQLSMLLGTHGPAYGMYGACATFGLLLNEAHRAIQSGEVDLAIVGTSDNTPPSPLVSGFYGARVLAGGATVSYPLTDMRGTHVSGGACLWIVASEEILKKRNLGHFGVEISGVGISSDAEHIITPSKEGPKACIRDAFSKFRISLALDASEPTVLPSFDLWDMHATGTPGDWSELQLIAEFIDPKKTVISARKGLFGHGMGSCGGWELTALAFSAEKTESGLIVWPSGIPAEKLHPAIAQMGLRLSLDTPISLDASHGTILTCGKLSMGIGGISSCVIFKVDTEIRSAKNGQ